MRATIQRWVHRLKLRLGNKKALEFERQMREAEDLLERARALAIQRSLEARRQHTLTTLTQGYRVVAERQALVELADRLERERGVQACRVVTHFDPTTMAYRTHVRFEDGSEAIESQPWVADYGRDMPFSKPVEPERAGTFAGAGASGDWSSDDDTKVASDDSNDDSSSDSSD